MEFLKDLRFLLKRTLNKNRYNNKQNIFNFDNNKFEIKNNFYPYSYSTNIEFDFEVVKNKSIRNNRLKYELITAIFDEINKNNISLDDLDMFYFTYNGFEVLIDYENLDQEYELTNEKEEVYTEVMSKHFLNLTIQQENEIFPNLSLTSTTIVNKDGEYGTSLISVRFRSYRDNLKEFLLNKKGE